MDRVIRTASILLLFLAMILQGCRQPSPVRNSLPQTMLWAWQRPEDLRFIASRSTGVAPLVGTSFLGADGIRMHRRLNPLSINEDTEVLPVIRIEVDTSAPPVFDHELVQQTVESIFNLVAVQGKVQGLQIDFDAPLSLRPFYRDLLFALRARMGPRAFLSITALASWCMEEDWLQDLPVDEVVPMLFGMGQGARSIREYLAREGHFPSGECRSAFGLVVGQPFPGGTIPNETRRLYYFAPRAWTKEMFQLITRRENGRTR